MAQIEKSSEGYIYSNILLENSRGKLCGYSRTTNVVNTEGNRMTSHEFGAPCEFPLGIKFSFLTYQNMNLCDNKNKKTH